MYKETQPNPSDIIEWSARPFDKDDIELSRQFRQGTLNCQDILAVEKYQREGMLGALVLPNSLLQYGVGWFRMVPVGFEGHLVENPEAKGDPLTPKEKDDFSLKLLASIFIAANSKHHFREAGGLIDLLKCDLKLSRQSTPDSDDKASCENITTSDAHLTKRLLPNSQDETRVSKKHHSGSQLSEGVSKLIVEPNLQQSSDAGSPEASNLAKMQPGGNVINNGGSTRPHRTESLSASSQKEFWQNLESNGHLPQSLQLTSEMAPSYWADRYTVKEGFSLENFTKYVIHFFIVSRSKAPPLNDKIDLSGSPSTVADKMLAIIRSIYALPSGSKLSHEDKVTVNQALCIIGFYLSGKDGDVKAKFLAKHDDEKFRKASSVTRIVSVAMFVARIWDKSAPISRMHNLHVNFYRLSALLEEDGTFQMEEAIRHLQEKYPPTFSSK